PFHKVGLFGFSLLFACGPNRHVMKGHTIEVGKRLCILMVADDHRYFALQFIDLVPVQQVHQAMVVTRNEYSDARTPGSILKTPLHPKTIGYFTKLSCEVYKLQR